MVEKCLLRVRKGLEKRTDTKEIAGDLARALQEMKGRIDQEETLSEELARDVELIKTASNNIKIQADWFPKEGGIYINYALRDVDKVLKTIEEKNRQR